MKNHIEMYVSGSHSANYTPTHRGFHSHLGYWTGRIDYYDHTGQELYGPLVTYIHILLPVLFL